MGYCPLCLRVCISADHMLTNLGCGRGNLGVTSVRLRPDIAEDGHHVDWSHSADRRYAEDIDAWLPSDATLEEEQPSVRDRVYHHHQRRFSVIIERDNRFGM